MTNSLKNPKSANVNGEDTYAYDEYDDELMQHVWVCITKWQNTLKYCRAIHE